MVSLSAETRLLGTVSSDPSPTLGAAMPAPNYRQQKRQKELARQSRQAEKDARRAKKDAPAAAATADEGSQPVAVSPPAS